MKIIHALGVTCLTAAVMLTACQGNHNQPGESPQTIVAPGTGDTLHYYRPSWSKPTGSPCKDMAHYILERDAGPRAVDTDHDGCRDEGTILDLYTGQEVPARDAQIDHVFPAAVAWRAGASRWDRVTWRRFFNDPENLRAVAAQTNERKSDLTPAEMLAPVNPPRWQPPTPAGRCAFATIYRHTAEHYALPVPAADDAALREMARSCPR